MRRSIAVLVLAFFLGAPAFGQVKMEDMGKLRGTSNALVKLLKVDIADKPAFVMLNTDYSVTPGDAYTLYYQYDTRALTLSFIVEGDYAVNLSFFGKLSAKGMSFRDLKAAIEAIVLKAYPGSLPRIAVTSIGTFAVPITGEVEVPGYAQAWSISRLSDLLSDRLTSYSSLRDVEVISQTGVSREYDLYRAAMTMDASQNPLIRAGDSVVVHRLSREVFAQGEVYRPGAYQLVEGENLHELLAKYAAGFTALADTTRAYLVRVLPAGEGSETLYLDLSKADSLDTELRDMDLLVVPGRLENLPVIFLEGALYMKPGVAQPVSARIPWPITANERISTVIRSLPADAITPVCDLANAFIIRSSDGTVVPVDLDQVYFGHDLSNDPALSEGDRIVIPAKLYTVIVAGAVSVPGPQPYVAGKKLVDYLQLAGGIDPELSTGKGIMIIDREGVVHQEDRVIEPEDRIYVPKNNPSYVFNRQIGPIVATSSAVLALIVSIVNLIARFF